MKPAATLLLLALAWALPAAAAVPSARRSSAPVSSLRQTLSFDANWRFLKSDPAGAEQPAFDDSGWRTLSVPHDWSIEGPFDQDNKTGQGGAFLPAGIGWYRKHFVLPPSEAERRVFIEFDGVMANSDVWINGVHLGKHPYGYVSFRYELTGHLHFGASPNVIAVRCDDSAQPASRWYAGTGIYRHVHLIVTDPLHLRGWSTFVSTPSITNARATVRVESTVVNQSDRERSASLAISIIGPDGKRVAEATTPAQPVAAGQTANFDREIAVPRPQRWDIAHPYLYRARVVVLSQRQKTDDDAVTFGIREFHFDPATGFWLNGRNLKILGACLHAEYGAFGAAVPVGAWEHRLKALRALGVNAIRTAHNPPAPEFLDLCDRMGFLVMDEMFDCWTVGKNPYDYHLYFRQWSKTDTRDTVRRDRNHPSIILWSAGNEIHDTPNAPLAHSILASLVAVFHQNDPTRPVTMALFRPNASHDYDNGLADLLDVVGQNYRPKEILAAHAQKPTRKIIGTENTHDRDQWVAVRDNPPYSGEFIWSGADYLGEAGRWPNISSQSGLLDRTDFPHPHGLQRQSWWSSTPVVHMVRRVAPAVASPTDPGYEPPPRRGFESLFPDWTPKNLGPHQEHVEVYSNAQQVTLLLNGKSLGSQAIHPDASPRTWEVAFAPGTLRAIARNGGKIVATEELRTAGKPARIVLTASEHRLTPAWDDVSFVTAMVVDANGVKVPTADNPIRFAVAGPAAVAAVDNADPRSHEPFQAAERHAYQGRCVAMLKASPGSGRIAVTASAPGLAPATITLQATPAKRASKRDRGKPAESFGGASFPAMEMLLSPDQPLSRRAVSRTNTRSFTAKLRPTRTSGSTTRRTLEWLPMASFTECTAQF